MASRSAGLMNIIEEQRKDIEKYKNKLRDVVTAHRSLIKEKEALENSLKAIQNQKVERGATVSSDDNETEDEKQVAALVNSLTTLTAEKARIEASYQTDKKLLREERDAFEKKCNELQQCLTSRDVEIEELRSRVIIERHERDKEQANHGAMIKELQSLVAAERNARIKLEENNGELRKRTFGGAAAAHIEKYQKLVNRLENELDLARRNLELAEKGGKEPPRELLKLQDEIRNLQIEHQTAIQQERQRAENVEERAKKQALIQEERVINLEARLAELSATVGTYDRLRLQDQSEILKLKEFISASNYEQINMVTNKSLSDGASNEEQENLVNNAEFLECSSEKEVHCCCVEDLERVRREFEAYKMENKLKKDSGGSKHNSLNELVNGLRERIRILSEEFAVKDGKRQLEVEQLKLILRNERQQFKEKQAAAESDYQVRLNSLETELQKLRQRSLAMIEDKDQEIHSLQGTFQTFLPGARGKEVNELPSLTNMRDGPRMLHYANELARRDVEIASLRRAKHKIETALRDIQKTMVTEAENHREEKENLNEEIARLNRSQSREGANIEYLKNVVLSFLISNDPHSRRHMCNAIAAVLKFTEQEQEKIAKQSHNRWWNISKTPNS